jgi:hypothetical protein
MSAFFIVVSVLDVRAYSVSFSASLDMNQVPEKLYLGQNLKQYVMKETVISLHLVEILGVSFLCGCWCSRGCCLVILRWIRTDTVGDVGFLLCVTLHNVFCIVTLSIVIYVDNICIR